MFVDYRLKYCSTNFDGILRDCFWKCQGSLESSLNYVHLDLMFHEYLNILFTNYFDLEQIPN